MGSPGFQTTHDQQQLRRFAWQLPLRVAAYTCALAGWWAGPDASFGEAALWLRGSVDVVGLIWLALFEFSLTLRAEGLWSGPPGSRLRTSAKRWLIPLGLLALAFAVAHALHWALAVRAPAPILGAMAAVAVLLWGTLRNVMRQPPERISISDEFLRDQISLMTALSSQGGDLSTPSEMRTALLAALVDLPENRAARLLAWQLALRENDLSDAEHHLDRMRRLNMPEQDISEMEALCALAADDPARAADALERRADLVHRHPRRTLSGQRADFVALLHLAHARVRASQWGRAAECLDSISEDYETAPFVGQMERLMVNHMRWQAARALDTEKIAREIEQRCRRFVRRTVRPAARRHLRVSTQSPLPDPLHWWPQVARGALEWWEKARAREL